MVLLASALLFSTHPQGFMYQNGCLNTLHCISIPGYREEVVREARGTPVSSVSSFWVTCLKFCHTSMYFLFGRQGKTSWLSALWLCFFSRRIKGGLNNRLKQEFSDILYFYFWADYSTKKKRNRTCTHFPTNVRSRLHFFYSFLRPKLVLTKHIFRD